jgi:hypothetical protein
MTVTVGWDPPLQTFFGQVMRPPTSADEDDVIVAWVGTHRQEIPTVAQLCMHLSPYTDIPVATQARLAQDQVESLPPTALQARLVHLLEQRDQQRGHQGMGADRAEERATDAGSGRAAVAGRDTPPCVVCRLVRRDVSPGAPPTVPGPQQ